METAIVTAVDAGDDKVEGATLEERAVERQHHRISGAAIHSKRFHAPLASHLDLPCMQALVHRDAVALGGALASWTTYCEAAPPSRCNRCDKGTEPRSVDTVVIANQNMRKLLLLLLLLLHNNNKYVAVEEDPGY